VPRSVGWLDNGDGSVTFAYAAPGDTNIDWTIDILDAADFFATGLYDAGNYNSAPGTAVGVAAVPEPSGFAVIGLAIVGALASRSRRGERDA
jgi:hypothetical protein